jgi:hypothetical protein
MSGQDLNWKNYVNEHGDFELPLYLYRVINSLMKSSLDMGTLLSEDKAKLRAYKEQTKNLFKKRWLEVAQSLESFDLIIPCGCEQNEYCKVCGGSRYILNSALSSDQLKEVAVVVGAEQDAELADKLHKGLVKALKELKLDDEQNLSSV